MERSLNSRRNGGTGGPGTETRDGNHNMGDVFLQLQHLVYTLQQRRWQKIAVILHQTTDPNVSNSEIVPSLNFKSSVKTILGVRLNIFRAHDFGAIKA